MMEMIGVKKGDAESNIRSRSTSRERVSLLGDSAEAPSGSVNLKTGLRGRENKRRTRASAHPYEDKYDEEKVSLLGKLASSGVSKRNSKFSTKRRGGKSRWTVSRMMRYVALLLISATASFLTLRKESKMVHWDLEVDVLVPKDSKETRCFETSRSKRDERCSCPDPDAAMPNNDANLWKSNHDHMVSQAKNAPKDLDIVFFGDNMIEQLSGTRGLGAATEDGMEEYFDTTFSSNHKGKFSAIALGSSGDTGPNLLWHWENGIQQAKLRPKLWFIMVGGNDLFVDKCIDRFVVANVLNVAKRIFEDQPDAKVVIHGIVPRVDDPDSSAIELGHLWNRAQGVNLNIRKWVESHSSRIYFMNVGQTLTADGGNKGRKNIDPHLIRDGINATPQGVRKWADLVVKKLVPILNGFDRETHRKQTKPPKPEDENPGNVRLRK